MQISDGNLFFSPSDLIVFMESPFASHMERMRLHDHSITDLIDPEDPMLRTLQEKGYAHEDEFLEDLKSEGKSIVLIERASPSIMQEQTRKAIRSGPDVIAQAYLELDNFGGLADFLIKVPGGSNLGDYHYEVWDTKLSKKMKPYFAIQLCCYAEMLEQEQGIRPVNVTIVLGNKKKETLQVKNYFAYYQSLKAAFLLHQEAWSPNFKPDPADSVSFGRWTKYAEGILSKRRHLSLVANITRTQIKRLESASINTIDALAKTDLKHVPKLNTDIFERLKSQAKIQISSEHQDRPDFKILPQNNERALGLSLLPPQSSNDIFFDIEGFPLIDGGLEYLWGATYFDDDGKRQFRDFWAHNEEEEKQAFIGFIDWVYKLWRQDPSMHIYHYASYEVSALRRLMGRYGSREHEVDTLLRNAVFVDLYNVVRHGLLVGTQNYSIKSVEHLYREKRDTDVASGSESVVVYEEWRTAPDGLTWETSPVLKNIRDYNIDDCNSTHELTVWLRDQQSSHNIEYVGIPVNDGSTEIEEETDTTRLRDKLLKLSNDESDETRESVLRNLAWLLEFHRRENKPTWWRLFERRGLTELDLYDDIDCLVGLQRTKTSPYKPTPRARNLAYEYSFNPNQMFKGQAKSFHILGEENLRVTALDYQPDIGLISLQSKEEPPQRLSLIPDEFVRPEPIPTAIQDVIENLISSDFTASAITDFLFRRPPRFVRGPRNPIIAPTLIGQSFTNAIVDAVDEMDESYLCIQGPPGAGKTFTARHVIRNLLSRGKRVGISSNSHQAIINLMKGVAAEVTQKGDKASLIKIGGDPDDPIFESNSIHFSADAKACASALNSPSLCLGGTAWFFCNALLTEEQGTQKLDYLFIDEAGQVSLANLVGMSRCTKNIILMGDQMQLGQPTQGSHPDESGQSILEYLLEKHATIPPNLGIFLPQTYRMHPEVCQLISDQVYDSRLQAAAPTLNHLISIPTEILSKKAGLHFIEVEHEGNTQGSEEEVSAIVELAQKLIGVPSWKKIPIGWEDILFVAPYNYQVNLLRAALPKEARVGTVDKFQGQEAPIVFVSMCVSDASESPRGLEFLFSKNRLNVAISRAQSLAIIAGSPRLITTPVNNLKQMALVNFYSEIVRSGL